MATLKKDSSGRITAASADDLVEMLAPKKSMYDEDMARMTKGILPNKPLPSNYPVGKTDASGMTLMPNGNWRDEAGKETAYHKPTINLPPKEEAEGKKKGGAIKHYKSAADAVKAAQKRGDKSITVKFNQSKASKRADGIATKGHTKGRYI